MSVSKLNIGSFTKIVWLITGVFLAGCSSSDPEPMGEQVTPQTTDSENDPVMPQSTGLGTGLENEKFDGSWRADCFKDSLFGVPEEAQPDGYMQKTLTINSSTNSYSLVTLFYTDSQCVIDNADAKPGDVSGDIRFDGLSTTRSGLEATVVYYFNNGTSPDVTGLLYRDGDILYLEERGSTLIEDIVPDKLSLSVPWRLVN